MALTAISAFPGVALTATVSIVFFSFSAVVFLIAIAV